MTMNLNKVVDELRYAHIHSLPQLPPHPADCDHLDRGVLPLGLQGNIHDTVLLLYLSVKTTHKENRELVCQF